MDTACFLNEIAQKLASGSVSSRDLASLDFEADGRDISIRVRSTLLPYWYPQLDLILGRIGSVCTDRGITLSQLRRITFSENEVCVEARDADAPVDTILAFPIEAVVGLPVPTLSIAAS